MRRAAGRRRRRLLRRPGALPERGDGHLNVRTARRPPGLERRGFDHIPEDERTMTLPQTAFFWIGTNANLFFVSVGVIALDLGLEVWEALVAVVLGTSLFAAVGVAAVGGGRAGVPAPTVTPPGVVPPGDPRQPRRSWGA